MNGRALAIGAACLAVACLPAEWGASAILHPWKRPVTARPDLPFRDVSFRNDGLTLRGWLFPAAGDAPRRGLVVYLHGIADNRQSGIGHARWLTARGYDVLAYDARAHGASEGRAATYGVHERRDVSAALDAVGTTRREVDAAIGLAETRGGFDADDASAAAAAPRVRVPVLLVHGARDRKTGPHHSERIHGFLAGPRRLVLVPGAGHDDVFAHAVTLREIEQFLAGVPR
jgi:pimeloyl-ACP methyl ester carboxylesterase